MIMSSLVLETCVCDPVELTHPEDRGGDTAAAKQQVQCFEEKASNEVDRRNRNREVYWYGKRQRAILIRAIQL